MKCWWTMLIPRAIASAGPAIRTSCAVEQDRALVGSGEPVEDVHERRLAGPVLAEQGVDLARPHVEVDVVVGDDARVALRDPAHLQGGSGDRLAHLPSVGPRRPAVPGGPGYGTAGPAPAGPAVGRRENYLRYSAGSGVSVLMLPSFIPARAASILAWTAGVMRLAKS